MIQLADQKAAFISTAGSAFLAFLHHQRGQASWLKAPHLWTWADVMSALAMGALAGAVVAALCVVIPRLAGSVSGQVYWEAIAGAGSARDYSSRVAGKDCRALTDELLRHAHELALVCRSKYRALNIAIRLGAVGALFGVAYLVSPL